MDELASRFFNGFGEAFLCTLAPPILDDVAPEGKKSTYIGYYFTAIPLGMALGIACTFALDSWAMARFLFMLMALIWFALFLFFYLKHSAFASGNRQTTDTLSFSGPIANTLTSQQWLLHVVAYGAQTWFLGGASAWAVQYISIVYLTKAQLVIGAGTLGTSLVGSSLGGYCLDYLNVRWGWNRLKACCFLNSIFMSMCVPLGLIVPWMEHLGPFYAVFFFIQFLNICTMAPINLGIMESVAPADRGTALGLATLGMHIIGDVPSNILYGMEADRITKGAAGFTSTLACSYEALVGDQSSPVVHGMWEACELGQRSALALLCCGMYASFFVFAIALYGKRQAADQLSVELDGQDVM